MSMKHISPGTYIVRVDPGHEWLFECVWKAYYSSFNTDRISPPPSSRANPVDDMVNCMLMLELARTAAPAPPATGEGLFLANTPPLFGPPLPDRAPYPFLTGPVPPPLCLHHGGGGGGPFESFFVPAYPGNNDHPVFPGPPGDFPASPRALFTRPPPANPHDDAPAEMGRERAPGSTAAGRKRPARTEEKVREKRGLFSEEERA